MWYEIVVARTTLFGLLLTAVCVCACGSGSPASPTPAAGSAQGTWSGDYTQGSCADNGAIGFCASFLASNPVGAVRPLTLTLTQQGEQVSGTLGLGTTNIPVSGSATSAGRLTLTGAATMPISGVQTTFTLFAWNTEISGRNMTGTFGLTFTFATPNVGGVPSTEQTLRTVTRVG